MLHLTFNIRYSIACLCAHLLSPPKSTPPTDGISLTQRWQRRIHPTGFLSTSLRVVKIFRCGFYPAQEFLLCCRDFPLSGSQEHSSVDMTPPTQKQPWIQLHCWDFPHSGGQKFADTADGITPTREQRCRLTKSLPGQTSHKGDRNQYSEEA